MLHILWSIILGSIAGAIANFIMHTHMGFIMTSLLGIVGSIIGDGQRIFGNWDWGDSEKLYYKDR